MCSSHKHQRKKGPFTQDDKSLRRKNFSLGPGSTPQVCANFTSCQSPTPRKLLLLTFIFFNFFLISTEVQGLLRSHDTVRQTDEYKKSLLLIYFTMFSFFVEWHINLRGLFNTKAILREEQQWWYLTHSWEDKGVHTFPKGICPKLNVIAWLEFKLAYYDSADQCFNHYITRAPPAKQQNW